VVPNTRACKRDWLRDGFYLRLQQSFGYTSLSGSGPSGAASISGLGSGQIIAIGWSFMRGLALAGTLQSGQVTGQFKGGPYPNATFTSSDGKEISVTNKALAQFAQIGAQVDWYPSLDSGFHVGIGVGFDFVSLTNQADDTTRFGTGAAGTLVVGYDWSIAPEWALGLALVASGSTRPSVKDPNNSSDAAYQLRPMSISVASSILFF
jgi:hypothetical protein